MSTIAIDAKSDFLDGLGSVASPMTALSELVWNGLDAGSEEIIIDFEQNPLTGLEKISVRDFGSGIDHEEVSTLFGNLGNSWKKSAGRIHGRAMHGKNGQGRFKAFALGDRVVWNTVYKKGGEHFRYQIFGHSGKLETLETTDPIPATTASSGTEVTISEISKTLGSLLEDTAQDDIAKKFAAYLSQYPHIKISYCGKPVNAEKLQCCKKDIILDDIEISPTKKVKVNVSIIEWNVPTKRALYLCDTNGVSLHETEAGVQIHAPGFQFTAYVQCDHFRDLDIENKLLLEELHPDVMAILRPVKLAVKTYFRKRLAERQSGIVEQWKKEKIYPYEDSNQVNSVELAERQVFDILAVNVQSYLPTFENADTTSKKFMFQLLAQALRQNPESLEQIITEVLGLKKEEQEDLATLLKNTTLSNIISSAKTVANRLDFIIGLENLLFDAETKKTFLERDQLHKILETEAWIFNEEFSLSGSEQRLEEVLQLHLSKLGTREDIPVLREEGKQGRIDLMLSRANCPHHDERDYLVVELKRPSQKINSEILLQVESYAIAVASDARFHSEKTRWRFIVISNEMDEHARRKSRQRDRPRGLVFDDAGLNIEVWAYDWAEILSNARSRLQFINESLNYDATRDSAKQYLQKTHAKFIPVTEGKSALNDEVSPEDLDEETAEAVKS